MDTTVRNAGSPQVRSRRRRAERHAAVRARRVDRDIVVSTAVEPTAERTADQRLGTAAVVGGLIGFVLMAAGVFVMSMAAGAGFAGSLWIAAFCAFWGGLGFGCMLGALASSVREERREAEALSPIEPPASWASVAGRSLSRRGGTW